MASFCFVFISLRMSCYIFAWERTDCVRGKTIKIGNVALEHFAQFIGPDGHFLNVGILISSCRSCLLENVRCLFTSEKR